MQFNKAHIWRTEMVLWKEMNEGRNGGKEGREVCSLGA